jgi:hypothetical protein
MSGVKDEYSVEEFSTEAAYPAFHDRVCSGRPDRSLDDLYTFTDGNWSGLVRRG